jgi:hypothetical protein
VPPPLAILAAALTLLALSPAQASPSFAISFPESLHPTPIDGRLVLLLSKDPGTEPRTQVDPDAPLKSPDIFGITVDNLAPGKPATIDAAAFGWPAKSLAAIPPGDYIVQAVLNRYETFHLATGATLKLPPDQGEGQNWATKPGNLTSTPTHLQIDPTKPQHFSITLDHKIPALKPPPDTDFIRHISMKSDLLSAFWGRPVYLGAHILLPAGFSTHPAAHYPLMVFHGHFPENIEDFRTTPADPTLKPDYSERFHLAGYNIIQQKEAYAFYQKWISPDFPRYLVVEIQHANPYYDDSYAVNSANLGPYGDAINHELIPYIEKTFRGLGQPWARFTYGGSTGGWEAMATQVFYPDMYNGAFIACPDPIDFHAYTNIDLYKDDSAYVLHGQVHDVERPAIRDDMGEVYATQRDANYQERALGEKGRSTGQYDIWQAVFSPAGPDGYPAPIFDKLTGKIDHKIAAYWRDHYDLTHIIERDWATLGPKLAGKLHIYVGSADTFYLNDAVYLAQATLEKLQNPAYGGEIAYGDRAEHCWNGDPTLPNAYSRLHYDVMYLPKILKRIEQTAPKGGDLTSWRY